jgi:hypothetical protein
MELAQSPLESLGKVVSTPSGRRYLHSIELIEIYDHGVAELWVRCAEVLASLKAAQYTGSEGAALGRAVICLTEHWLNIAGQTRKLLRGCSTNVDKFADVQEAISAGIRDVIEAVADVATNARTSGSNSVSCAVSVHILREHVEAAIGHCRTWSHQSRTVHTYDPYDKPAYASVLEAGQNTAEKLAGVAQMLWAGVQQAGEVTQQYGNAVA